MDLPTLPVELLVNEIVLWLPFFDLLLIVRTSKQIARTLEKKLDWTDALIKTVEVKDHDLAIRSWWKQISDDSIGLLVETAIIPGVMIEPTTMNRLFRYTSFQGRFDLANQIKRATGWHGGSWDYEATGKSITSKAFRYFINLRDRLKSGEPFCMERRWDRATLGNYVSQVTRPYYYVSTFRFPPTPASNALGLFFCSSLSTPTLKQILAHRCDAARVKEFQFILAVTICFTKRHRDFSFGELTYNLDWQQTRWIRASLPLTVVTQDRLPASAMLQLVEIILPYAVFPEVTFSTSLSIHHLYHVVVTLNRTTKPKRKKDLTREYWALPIDYHSYLTKALDWLYETMVSMEIVANGSSVC